MKKDLDKLMKEKLSNAQVADVLDDFDKNAIWKNIESRLESKIKKRSFRLYTHTAALIAGMLLGFAMFNAIMNSKKVPEQKNITSALMDSDKQPAILKKDTVYIEREPEIPPKSNPTKVMVRQKKSFMKKEKNIQQVQDEVFTTPRTDVFISSVDTTLSSPENQVIITAFKKQDNASPVHLLDIDNEDRKSALHYNDAVAPQKAAFTFHISTARLPDNKNMHKTSLLKSLIKK